MAIAEPKPEAPTAAPAPVEEGNPTLQRLEDQIAWYDRKSGQSQQRFKLLKAIELATAAAIPVVAAFDVPVYVAGILGAVVVVTEGVLHVNQYHQNWITYRSTKKGGRASEKSSRCSCPTTAAWSRLGTPLSSVFPSAARPYIFSRKRS